MAFHVDDRYRVNLFLDTNILVDFLDGTFPNFNNSIQYLISSRFASLKSSHYVIYELIEVRKREHFLRQVVEKRLKDKVSISKLVGRKGIWEFDTVKYDHHKAVVKAMILQEKEKIANDFGIDWEHNLLHEDLLKPTLELCLETTISREDSLVLLSCTYPNKNEKEKHIILLTRDRLFSKSYNNDDVSAIFDEHELAVPEIIRTSNVECKNKYNEDTPLKLDHYNDQVCTKEQIEQFWTQKLKELIIEKNSETFLGYTYERRGDKCLFFELEEGKSLNKDIGLTIIGKNLDFIYFTRIISEFWNNTKIENYPFVKDNEKSRISFIPYDTDDNGVIVDFRDTQLLTKMKEKDNLIFINNVI